MELLEPDQSEWPAEEAGYVPDRMRESRLGREGFKWGQEGFKWGWEGIREGKKGGDGKNENYGNPLVHRLGSFILRPGRYCEVNYD